MNGQSWDTAGRFAYEWEGIGKLAAAAHCTGAETQRDEFSQYSGSISFLHSTGFNITGYYGARDYEDHPVRGNDDVWSAYGKLGYKFGIHAVSVDYGYAEDLAAAILMGCGAKGKPYDYQPTADEMKEEPGLFTGEEGEFAV